MKVEKDAEEKEDGYNEEKDEVKEKEKRGKGEEEKEKMNMLGVGSENQYGDNDANKHDNGDEIMENSEGKVN